MVWQRPMNGYPRIWSEFVNEETKQKFVIKDLTPEYYDIALGYLTNIYYNESAHSKVLNIDNDPTARRQVQQRWMNIMKSNTAFICCTVEEVPRVAAIAMTVVKERDQEKFINEPEPQNSLEEWIREVVDELLKASDFFEKFPPGRYLWAKNLLVLPEFRRLGIATEMLKSRITIAKALGLQGTGNVVVSSIVQIVARTAGFESLAEGEFLGQQMALMGVVVAK